MDVLNDIYAAIALQPHRFLLAKCGEQWCYVVRHKK